MTDPSAFLRRSPLRHLMEKHGSVEWRSLIDTAVADQIGAGAFSSLAVVDLSPLPRIGFKGPGTLAAMQARGVVVGSQFNRAYRQPDTSLCLALGPGEVLLLGALRELTNAFAAMEDGWRIEDEDTYPLPRRDSHAWLAFTGDRAPEAFAKICGVDLRFKCFDDLCVAQTSVAKTNAIVVRADIDDAPVYHLLFDCASAAYMLSCVLDAAAEFGGRLSGLRALLALETGGSG
jgi:sarcosine oxidase subunit gamma